jgi:hypothetical protein
VVLRVSSTRQRVPSTARAKLACEGRDAAQPLEKIERYTLAFQQRAGQPAHPGQALAGLNLIAAGHLQTDLLHAAALLIDHGKQLDARHHQRLAGEEAPLGAHVNRDTRLRGDIAGPDVFGQGAAHGFEDLRMIHVEAHH